MTNIEKYDAAFVEAFMITHAELKGLKYQDISEWDSVGHMQLMTSLEEVFAIEMEIDDIIAFSGYDAGKEILAKYGVMF